MGGAATPFLLAAPFHYEFATQALHHGWLRVWFLEIDGRPVAALHGFRFADAESTEPVSDQDEAAWGSMDQATSNRRYCGRQSDLVLPEHLEYVLSITGVNGKNVRSPPSGRLGSRRWF